MEKSIDFLDLPTAKAFSSFQETAVRYNYKFDLSTSIDESNHLFVDSSTRYYIPQNDWIDAEFYFYGEVTDMGGKGNPNIHVTMPGVGSFAIDTPRNVLASYEKNPLYKPLGIRASGKQNLITGEIDKSSLKFIEFVEHAPDYDESYLNSLIEKSRETWRDIENPEEWIRELRGAIY